MKNRKIVITWIDDYEAGEVFSISMEENGKVVGSTWADSSGLPSHLEEWLKGRF